MNILKRISLVILAATAATLVGVNALAGDFYVYSIYKSLDLGEPGEKPQKDFYINMGSQQGLNEGSVVQVLRRTSTYDLNSQKLYKDLTFPIAKLKVIHVESNAAVARLDSMVAAEKTPALAPRAVMVGDLVKVGE